VNLVTGNYFCMDNDNVFAGFEAPHRTVGTIEGDTVVPLKEAPGPGPGPYATPGGGKGPVVIVNPVPDPNAPPGSVPATDPDPHNIHGIDFTGTMEAPQLQKGYRSAGYRLQLQFPSDFPWSQYNRSSAASAGGIGSDPHSGDWASVIWGPGGHSTGDEPGSVTGAVSSHGVGSDPHSGTWLTATSPSGQGSDPHSGDWSSVNWSRFTPGSTPDFNSGFGTGYGGTEPTYGAE
jgi:hypothetical protein